MLRLRNIVCLLLCLQYILYEGSAHNINNHDAFVYEIIDWKCKSNADCSVERSSCVDETCQCATGFIYNENMTSCIKVATRYGDDCTESIQCSRYLYSGGFCMNATCVCAEGYYYLHGRCNAYSGLLEKCHKDDDCYVSGDFSAMSCVSGICKCSTDYYQREYRSCRPAAKGVGDKCVIDNDCKQFNESAYCQYDNTCVLPKRDGATYEFLYSNNNNLQNSNKTETVGKCTVDEDCKNLGQAFCGPSGYCACKRTFFYREDLNACIPELGEPCQRNDTINIEYSECRDGKWKCVLDRVVSKNNRECEKVTKQYNAFCATNVPCYIFGPDAVCENNHCVCNEKSRFIESEFFCWGKKGIGETCHQNIDCYINRTDTKLLCKDNVCSCPNGTHPNSNRTTCIHSSAGIGSECEMDNDCNTKNAKCVNSVCACKDNYYVSDDQCLPGVNANCSTDTDCKINNTKCVTNRCTCKAEYVALSVDSCIPVASFGAPCEKDVQCSANLPNAVCSSSYDSITNSTISTCTCAKDYHYNLHKCFKRRVLGNSCMNLGECYLDSGDRVVCKNGRCACDWGYIQVNDTVCKNIQRYNINDGSIRTNTIGLIPILLFTINFLI
ncbi:hypothetical protein ANTQUA_LOCUS5020 [Anthophora quadrimaculata]